MSIGAWVQTKRKGDARKGQRWRGNVDRLAAMAVVGWGIGERDEPVVIALTAAGLPVGIVLRRVDRPDVNAAHPGTPARPFGFIAEIESSIWRAPIDLGVREGGAVGDDRSGRGAVDVLVSLDGRAFPRVLSVSHAALDEWWAHWLASPPSADRERQLSRLLSHVAAAGGAGVLAAPAAQAVAAEARRRGLGGALQDGDRDGLIARALRQRALIERVDGLEIEGWAHDPEGGPQAFHLRCEGREVPCDVVRLRREDVRAALGATDAMLGFRVVPTPALWEHANAEGDCMLTFDVHGHTACAQPFVIGAQSLRAAWDELAVAASTASAGPSAGHAPRLRLLLQLEAHGPVLAARGVFPEFDASTLARLVEALDPQGLRHDPSVRDDPVDSPRSAAGASAGVDSSRRIAVESAANLTLVGWAHDPAVGGEIFRLRCNGQDVECHVLRTHREDVRRAIGATDPFLGFEIQLPAAAWRHADAQGACALTLTVNDVPVPEADCRLDKATLEALAERLSDPRGRSALRRAEPPAWRARFAEILLVEHLRATGWRDWANPRVRELIDSAQVIDAAWGGRGDIDPRHEWLLRDDVSRKRRVWRLQRRFNALVDRAHERGEPLSAALQTILADADAVGIVRVQLLLGLVAPLCGDPAFDLLLAQLPLEAVAFHASAGDNWHRSLYVACLARSGCFDDAAVVIDRIAQAPSQGWLNTECIALAIRLALAAPGDESREAVVDAFVRLVASLEGGYWSRLHDHGLVDASVEVVFACLAAAADAPLPSAAAGRLRALLDCLGLVPRFWQCLQDGGAADFDAPDLRRARIDFECLRDVLGDIGSSTSDSARVPARLRECIERLRRQREEGAADAAQVLRELILFDLGRTRAGGESDDLAHVFVLESLGPTDPLRLEQHPIQALGAVARETCIWPTTDSPVPVPVDGESRAAFVENRLVLCAPPARVAALREAEFLVICVVRNERTMLPHFLAHYRRLGAKHFVFVDNASDDGTREMLLDQDDVVLYGADTDYRDAHFGVAWQQAVLAAHALGKWAVVVDADELLLYPECESLPLAALLRRFEERGYDAAQTLMLDLYPRGALRDTDFGAASPADANWFDRQPLLRWHLGAGRYSNAPTWLSALRHRLIPHSPPNAFTAQKIALFRYLPWVRLSEGLHYAAGVTPAPEALFLGHYKYHAGFRDKVLREIERKQHYDGASEYAHYLAMVAEPDATLFAPELSVHLDDSRSLPRISGAGAADEHALPGGEH